MIAQPVFCKRLPIDYFRRLNSPFDYDIMQVTRKEEPFPQSKIWCQNMLNRDNFDGQKE